MKYHINNDYEVKPCGASDESRCPFFGRDGESNHFTNPEEAQAKAEEKLSQKHNSSAAKTKRSTPQFKKNKAFIKESIVEYGNTGSNKELKEVHTVKEMVSEWFDGDRQKYNDFKKLIDDNGFTPETKKSVAHLILQGIPVQKERSVYDISESNGISNEDSEITILEESSEKIDWNSLDPNSFVFRKN